MYSNKKEAEPIVDIRFVNRITYNSETLSNRISNEVLDSKNR